jgi:hypothetical protein
MFDKEGDLIHQMKESRRGAVIHQMNESKIGAFIKRGAFTEGGALSLK